MKKLFLVLLVLVPTLSICGQDIIYKKNKDTISCKVIEIGLVEVKYRIPEKYKDVVLVVAKDDILKIKYENGEEQVFVNEMYDKNSYADNNRNAIKIHPFSPFSGNLAFSYERSIKAGQSYEGTLGFIGLGINLLNVDPVGVYAKFGYKFIKNPDFYLRGMRYAHLLKGTYFKPEIALTVYSFNKIDYISSTATVRESVISSALLLNFGKQWVFDNRFAVDFSIGFGYGLTSLKKDDYSGLISQFGFTVDPNTGLAYTSNFKVAYLF
jgi:hypothetical protein